MSNEIIRDPPGLQEFHDEQVAYYMRKRKPVHNPQSTVNMRETLRKESPGAGSSSRPAAVPSSNTQNASLAGQLAMRKPPSTLPPSSGGFSSKAALRTKGIPPPSIDTRATDESIAAAEAGLSSTRGRLVDLKPLPPLPIISFPKGVPKRKLAPNMMDGSDGKTLIRAADPPPPGGKPIATIQRDEDGFFITDSLKQALFDPDAPRQARPPPTTVPPLQSNKPYRQQYSPAGSGRTGASSGVASPVSTPPSSPAPIQRRSTFDKVRRGSIDAIKKAVEKVSTPVKALMQSRPSTPTQDGRPRTSSSEKQRLTSAVSADQPSTYANIKEPTYQAAKESRAHYGPWEIPGRSPVGPAKTSPFTDHAPDPHASTGTRFEDFIHPEAFEQRKGKGKSSSSLGDSLEKLVAPLRPRAKSVESDLFFADCAPPGMMDDCRACARPPVGALTNGLCADCVKMGKNAELTNEAPAVRVKLQDFIEYERNGRRYRKYANGKVMKHKEPKASVDEEVNPFLDPPTGHALQPSPSEALNNGKDYMKLSGQKKLREVRQTRYDDPGNPFAAAFEQKVPSLSSKYNRSYSYDNDVRAPLATTRRNGESPLGHQSAGDGGAAHSASAEAEEGPYVPPRAMWRRSSMPVVASTAHSPRNTKFYDFYDDILEEDKS